MVNRLASTVLAVSVVGAFLCGSGMTALAQTAGDLVGTWQLVSAENTAKDGAKTEPFGATPKGISVFGDDGHFVQVLTRAGLPKFASDNRLQGTAEENKAIVQGSVATYGTYSVSDKVLTLHVLGGTWASWTGTDQKRPITSFTKNEIALTAAASVGGTTLTTWRRVK
jgi:hypothetical protein